MKTMWRGALVVFLLCSSAMLRAVVIGQMDTFEDGLTGGWHVPGLHPAPPTNVATGGPSGAGDNFLLLTATGGGGPGGRLSALSGPQWAGDYIAAGVGQIVMDVNNFGPNELHLRLLFEDLSNVNGAPPVNLALSANAVILPAGSGWQRVIFDVTPNALLVETFGTVNGALSNTDVVRLFHNPTPAFPGPGIGIPTVSAQLGVDNIQAGQAARVPERFSPLAQLLCLALCAGVLAGWRRRLSALSSAA